MAPKDRDPKPRQQGVVYNFKCDIFDCNSTYIGKTGRTLQERCDEHIKKDNSALMQHQLNQGHPLPDIMSDSLKVIDKQNNVVKRKILESAYIKANDPDLNANIGQYELSNIYTPLIRSEGAGFIV